MADGHEPSAVSHVGILIMQVFNRNVSVRELTVFGFEVV